MTATIIRCSGSGGSGGSGTVAGATYGIGEDGAVCMPWASTVPEAEAGPWGLSKCTERQVVA